MKLLTNHANSQPYSIPDLCEKCFQKTLDTDLALPNNPF